MGLRNPPLGLLRKYAPGMGKKGVPKQKKPPSPLRELVAKNVAALMNYQYKDSSNRPLALSKAAGMSLSTVQRIIGNKTAATLDNIHGLATAFDLSPYQLFIDGLDPANPMVLRGATQVEQMLWAKLIEARQENERQQELFAEERAEHDERERQKEAASVSKIAPDRTMLKPGAAKPGAAKEKAK